MTSETAAVTAPTLSLDEARSLTDEVKQDAERLWRKLVELYDGGAHEVLGYSSWGHYFTAEFGGSSSRAYQILDAGRVAKALGSTIVERPANEAQARELVPLLDKPDELRDAWSEASANGEPTASKVHEVVQRRLPPQTDGQLERSHRWAVTTNILDGLTHFDRDPVGAQAKREVALIDADVTAKRGESITPERLRRASHWTALLADALERSGA